MAAHASCAVAKIRTLCAFGLVVWIRRLRRRAVTRAAADGCFAGGQIPLRDSSADLYVCCDVLVGSVLCQIDGGARRHGDIQ